MPTYLYGFFFWIMHVYVTYLSSTDDREDVCLHVKSMYVWEEESAETSVVLSALLLIGVNNTGLRPYSLQQISLV